VDKQNQRTTNQNIETYRQQLLEWWEEVPPMFVTSSEKRIGREEILSFVESAIASAEE
jgi:GTP-binding protein